MQTLSKVTAVSNLKKKHFWGILPKDQILRSRAHLEKCPIAPFVFCIAKYVVAISRALSNNKISSLLPNIFEDLHNLYYL